MAVVKTKVVPLGTHVSPEGEVEVTRERVSQWVDKFNECTSRGVKFPVCWGHQLSALPMESGSVDENAYNAAKFNAGYFTRLVQASDGSLDAEIDAPGLAEENGKLVSVATLDGVPVKTAIGEVSAMIGPWTDGRGQTHNDVIAHIALTPLPVVAGQAGFKPLSTVRTDRGFVCLSTGTFHGTRRLATMPDEKDKDKKPDSKEDSPAEEIADDLLQPAPDDDTPPSMAVDGPVEEPQLDQELEGIKALLAEAGMPLPPDTGPETFKRDLLVALTVLVGKLKETPPMESPEAEPQEKPREIPPPAMMMSTLRANPAMHKLATEDADRRRTERLAKLAELGKRNLPPAIVAELKTKCMGKLLSLNPKTGARLSLRIDQDLALLDRALPALGSPQTLLATARPGENPVDAVSNEKATYRADIGLDMTDSQYEYVKRQAASVSGRRS